MERDPCFTCFPSGDKVVCVEHKDEYTSSENEEKVARQFLYPKDNSIQFSLWLFSAQLKCFDKYTKSDRVKILEFFQLDNANKLERIVFKKLDE